MPAYSIVIPCYCDGMLAIEAIESCLRQKDEFAEIIFVDDGSPDESYELVANKFFGVANVHCFRIKNGGVSKARNFGFGKSKGKWIIFLDADDMLADDYLKNASVYLKDQKNEDELILVMPFCYFGEPDSARARWVKKYRPPMLGESAFYNLFKLSITNCFPISSAIVNRKFQSDGKLFDESLSHYEDWELWLNLSKKRAKFHYLPPSMSSATLIRIRDGVSSNSNRMLVARKSIARKYFSGTVMALWQIPLIGDRLRKSLVGFWRIIFRKSSVHPNLTGIDG